MRTSSAYFQMENGDRLEVRTAPFDGNPALDFGDITVWTTWDQLADLHAKVGDLLKQGPQTKRPAG